MRIVELIVDPGREEHIARHGVGLHEVEEIVFNRPYVRRTRQRRLRIVGQTEAGRYLTIILGPRRQGIYGLVTARKATKSEQRLYQRHHK